MNNQLTDEIQNLIEDLEKSKDVVVRKNAAEKLGELGSESNRVLSALRTAKKFDTNEGVQEIAKVALDKLGASESTQIEKPKMDKAEFIFGLFLWIFVTLLIVLILSFFVHFDAPAYTQQYYALLIYAVVSIIASNIVSKKRSRSAGNGIIFYMVLVILGSTMFRFGCSPAFTPFPISLCVMC
ncbi:MAG: hypothetical protein KF758_16175 [Anaerolineales bacterium]|nr:hypothetical protein [Anaerolineales bacterium]MBX3038451.1 hypothetical protein [Anaerolineales bacterium]